MTDPDVRKSYEILEKIGKGAYGKVYKARAKKSGMIVAIKKIKFSKDDEGIPAPVLREVSILHEMKHEHIVRLLDQILCANKLFLVFEFSGVDLKRWTEFNRLNPSIVKRFMRQMLAALAHCHLHRIAHRDLKPQNILVDPSGTLKLADFGMARYLGFLPRDYTPEVVTLWYRPPEILLGLQCTVAADMWSCGCIFAELLAEKPLFPGESEIDQLRRIFSVLGTPATHAAPTLANAPGMHKFQFEQYSPQPLSQVTNTSDSTALSLLARMLHYEPTKRISAVSALEHPYFN